MEKYDVVIEPKTGWFDIDLEGLWKYRDLILLFVKRNFIAQYKQTILGPAWAIIQPMLTTVIFTVVFGSMAGLSADGVPSFLFYMSGTIAWTYFSTCLTKTADTFTGNARIFGKVYFPRLVMPISTVLTNLIAFSIQFAMFLGFLAFYIVRGEVHPSIYILLLPLLVVQMAMLALGSGIIISALTTKYRDLTVLVSFGLSLWMFATPVAYPLSALNGRFYLAACINPAAAPMELLRFSLWGNTVITPAQIALSWVLTLLAVLAGTLLFNHVERVFADTV